jgi:hypothetical protein
MKRKPVPATAYRLMMAEEYALAAALREFCLTHRVHIVKWLCVSVTSVGTGSTPSRSLSLRGKLQ